LPESTLVHEAVRLQDDLRRAISIPYTSVLNGRKIKGEEQLNNVFMMLDKNRPVVVFTNTGMKASAVWFALKMMGYDARHYSYQDWMPNQPSKGYLE